MRLIPAVLLALALAALVTVAADGSAGQALFRWASARQHEVQDAMAAAIRAIKAGDPRAVVSLCLLSGAYGFVHAMGPGHGKVLLGGAALPFFPVWLASLSFDAAQISVILAVPMFVRVFSAPVAGMIADALGERRMGGEEAAEGGAEILGEAEVADLGGGGAFHATAEGGATELL